MTESRIKVLGTDIIYYKALKVKTPKPKVVYRSEESSGCVCGQGGTVYSLHQLNKSEYKISKRRKRCLSFSSESDEDFGRIFDSSQPFNYKTSNNKYEQELYDSVDSIILAKK